MAKYEVIISVSDQSDYDTLYVTDDKHDAFETAYGYQTGKYYSVVSLDYEDYCDRIMRKYGETVNIIIFVQENDDSYEYGMEIYDMPQITAFLNSKH